MITILDHINTDDDMLDPARDGYTNNKLPCEDIVIKYSRSDDTYLKRSCKW